MKVYSIILLLVLLVGITYSKTYTRQTSPLFEQFLSKFNKTYGTTAEHNKRFWIFYENSLLWKKANRGLLGSQRQAVYGMTKFADISREEFEKYYLNGVMKLSDKEHAKRLLESLEEVDTSDIPDSIDWRASGAVTGVKNQGMCGSCWSFSTTGNIEGQYFIKTNGTLKSFSEQELLDCDKVDQACKGGLPSQAYLELKRIGGLELESDYPYKGRKQSCQFKESKSVVKVTGGINLPQDEDQIAAWVAKNGPVSIGINAFMMQFYTGGIAHPWKYLCRPSRLDHGVLITGYGVENGVPFWNIKNSWGKSWGEDGYYRIYRGSNACGVSEMVTSATL